jgi:nicotinamide phosphoribosyltransferase
MEILPILNSDSYKQFHHLMYPGGITRLYSNFTPRSFKHMQTDRSVFFGLQYYLKEYLLGQWNRNFFEQPKEKVVQQFKRFHKHFSFYDMPTEHIEKLHDLGHLPILIKALPEGSLVREKVPFFTITNTHDDFAWLVNFLETQMSTCIWDLCVNATIAREYRKILENWADKTCDDRSFVQWQGHDFSQRGRSSTESTFNQAGHLLSFTGTDTIPSVFMLEEYYNANMETELIGSSVPASEHSVMTSYGKEQEIDSFNRILDQFPSGIVSIVSDSFDLWQVCTTFCTKLKDKILSREGKMVIRPDSGDPVDIVCGLNTNPRTNDGTILPYENCSDYYKQNHSESEYKGVIELLWEVFGGKVNSKGFKELDPHIGCIYGDSISRERAEAICERLAKKGFASNNIVFGIGSYTYNYNTRDSLGIAVKSTYCEVDGQPREIFKDPVTDDGMKKSARGLLRVDLVSGEYVLRDQVTHEEEEGGELVPVFQDGNLLVDHTLADIRRRLYIV